MQQNLTLQAGKDQLANLLNRYLAEEQAVLDQLSKEDRIAAGHPVKDVSTLDTFQANGRKYIVRQSLTIERFEQFEKVQVEVGYGVDFRQMFANMRSAYEHLNKSRPADAAIVLYNVMNGIKNNLEERENEVLHLCALFVCREGEDLAVYDPHLTTEKIADWKKEGISMESFFQLAFSLVQGFTPIYREVSASISRQIEEAKNPKKAG